jgi:hypothetical protein
MSMVSIRDDPIVNSLPCWKIIRTKKTDESRVSVVELMEEISYILLFNFQIRIIERYLKF